MLTMLEPILGNIVKEKILFLLSARGEVHARDISSVFDIHLLSVQNQLKKMEKGGILSSFLKGRTRLYKFNPRYAFSGELIALLKKAFLFMTKSEKDQYFTVRQRPRRSGKPL